MEVKQLRAIGSGSVVDKIVEEITEMIIRQIWKPGSRIPTELELMEALQVGRNSVREAIKVLVAMGLLEIRRPEGTYVTEHFSEKMLNPLIYSLALENDTSSSLVELRSLFDTNCLELAVKKADDEDCRAIAKACDTFVELLKIPSSGSEELLDADIRFHDEVCKAAHNELLRRFHFVITRLSRQSRISTIDYITNQNQREFLIRTHQKQVQMIKDHTLDGTYEVVTESFLYWKRNMMPEAHQMIDI